MEPSSESGGRQSVGVWIGVWFWLLKRREIGVVTLFGLFRQQRRRRLRRRRWGVEAVATATAERGHVGHTLTVALSLSLSLLRIERLC